MRSQLPRHAAYLAVPVIGAIWPVLFIAGNNPGEFSAGDLFVAALLAGLTGVACAALAAAVTRRVAPAMLGGLALVALMYAPLLVRELRQSNLLGIYAYGAHIPVLFGLLAVLLLLRLRALGDRVQPALLPVTLAVATLFLIAAAQSVGSLRWSRATRRPPDAEVASTTRATTLPDIYLIVLDQYASSEVTRVLFRFDNREFEDELRDLGFRIPKATWSNYAYTAASIASMLDMRHLDTLSRHLRDDRSAAVLNGIIANNAAFSLARKHGYRLVLVPSVVEAMRTNPSADRTIGPSSFGEWLGERMTSPLAIQVARLSVIEPMLATARIRLDSPWRAMAPLRRLREATAEPGPKFVFAHSMITHAPFLFTSNCDWAREKWPEYATAYRAQIECTNRRLLEFIKNVFARGTPAVILLQGDHGTSELSGRSLSDPRLASAAQVAELHGAFSAYRLPDRGALADTVTPVNLLRLVFNAYLGTALPPLPDAAWFGFASRPYDLVPVDIRALRDTGRFTRLEPSTGVMSAGSR